MNQIIKKKNKKKAFTLIELIIVLAIMAIIAAIAIPNFMAVRDNSKTKADIQSKETIKRTVLMLVSDETIAVGTASKICTLTFGTDKSCTGVTSTTFTDGEILKLKEAFKDVKAPQVTGVSFIITVDSSGNVTYN
ncbi:prepilin-type N-terminal cleavage/methylation domain-containing protein [Clostridium estertheticum]|uniref:prepilin-type N-terminal cleavage/methylation domain-containing protein n=1 Tax=Clostridium estertheticum TaxID=238834 RepID=UPI001C0E36E6|nr:prepilin-type N-terminal cleavage/methylation domain-containing protein [Clostridium estertheticum]MBU3198430.1 prepilin-type N-terminal cleavage/methylation domain-containing protein [Clostridium estertheticum]